MYVVRSLISLFLGLITPHLYRAVLQSSNRGSSGIDQCLWSCFAWSGTVGTGSQCLLFCLAWPSGKRRADQCLGSVLLGLATFASCY